MKKLFIFMFVVAMALTSCGKDDVKDPLVGTWTTTITESGFSILEELTFKSDNTGNVYIFEDGFIDEKIYFTWSADKNLLTVIMDDDPTDTEAISYSISGNKLTLDGDVVFTRK